MRYNPYGSGATRYEVQQTCLSGHIVTNYGTTSPEALQKFCTTCGSSTISACPACNTPLRGAEIDPGVVIIGFGSPPDSYCRECGAPYPWTEEKINAAMDLAAEIEDDPQEIDKIRKSISDLSHDSPRSSIAVVRVKKLMAKAGSMIAPALGKVLMEIATDEIKKQLGFK